MSSDFQIDSKNDTKQIYRICPNDSVIYQPKFLDFEFRCTHLSHM